MDPGAVGSLSRMTGQRLGAFRLVVVLAVGATALLAGSCGGSSKKTTTPAATRSTTTTPANPGSSAGPGTLPADAVAVAAGIPITQAEFDHWLAVAAKTAASGKAPPIDPSDPPGFNNCIAQARRDDPSLAKDSRQELKADCSVLFRSLSAEVMGFLIQSDWYAGYAARLGLVPSSQDVAKTFNAEKSQTFPTESKFNAFLKQEGETVTDIRFRVQVSLIAARLAARQKGNQSAQAAAVQREIKSAFLAGTVCTPTVAMADCSNYHASG